MEKKYLLIGLAILILTAGGGVVILQKDVQPSVSMPSPTPKSPVLPSPTVKISPKSIQPTKMPWEDSVCGNGICERCESRNECCNYPCVTDPKTGNQMCPPPTCLGWCPQDCQKITPAPSPKQEFTFPTEYSCSNDSDCVLKDRPYCCGERLEYYKWCYPKNIEPETISCHGVGSCPGIAGSAKSCVCQNGKCAVVF